MQCAVVVYTSFKGGWKDAESSQKPQRRVEITIKTAIQCC